MFRYEFINKEWLVSRAARAVYRTASCLSLVLVILVVAVELDYALLVAFRPFLMLAVLFQAIQSFEMFDLVNLLTSGGPGSTTELVSITLKREAFEKWRTGYSSAFAVILFVTIFGLANIYVKALNRVKQR